MDFVDVLKHKQRMCDHYYPKCLCHKCPLSGMNNNGEGFIGCAEFCMRRPEEAQTIIMNWVEEHPFKTNREVAQEILTEKFGDIFDVSQLGCGLLRKDCPNENTTEKIVCNECDEHNFWDREYKEVSEDAIRN